jgi:hypothetical protein
MEAPEVTLLLNDTAYEMELTLFGHCIKGRRKNWWYEDGMDGI